jgi:hypothetical protein
MEIYTEVLIFTITNPFVFNFNKLKKLLTESILEDAMAPKPFRLPYFCKNTKHFFSLKL